jgi:mono/diheme cytochrome c family protein
VALTPERAAQVVKQSGSARWVGFLAVLVVVLFVIVYYFYELGVPGMANTSRLAHETEAQAVTSVERGYNLFQANCARCHGSNGEGGIGPILNDQMKLYVHLSPAYINSVLTAGGRYVCGNPLSLMPVWADTNGGPLNYKQIQDLIQFIRASSANTYIQRDPSTNEELRDASGKPLTFKGWLDPSFQPAADATPVPDCWSSPAGAAGGSPAPGGSAAPGGSPAPSVAPGTTVLSQVASGVQFQTTSLAAPADKPFQITFDNQDAGIPHNIQIMDGSGQLVFSGDTVNGVNQITYNVPALKAGTYKFSCKWHPNMVGDLTIK